MGRRDQDNDMAQDLDAGRDNYAAGRDQHVTQNIAMGNARVGIQGNNITISGGLHFDADGNPVIGE